MKQNPPQPGPIREIAFPSVPTFRLDNGMSIVVVEHGDAPISFARLVVRAGRVDSPVSNSALLPAAVELLKEGTAHRTSEQIARELDRAAIHFDADVHLENSTLSVNALSGELDDMLGLVSEFVQEPTFPRKDLERILSQWDSHLRAQRSQPSFLASERSLLSLYGEHPYSRKSLRREHLATCKRAPIAELFERLFVPSRSHLLIAGSVPVERALSAARRHFGFWHRSAPRIEPIPMPGPTVGPRVCLVHRPHSVQARILISCRTFPRAHADGFRLKVANQILGGGASARLFLNLRERRGITYSVHSSTHGHLLDGELFIAADVRTESAVEAIEEIFAECRSMGQDPPTTDELDRAKSELIGTFLFRLETAESIGGLELSRRLYDLPDDYYETWIPSVRAVTGDEVTETSRRYLDPERFVITLVGDRDGLESGLAALGGARIFDAHGEAL